MRNKENLILVTGATGNVGRQVVSQLIGPGVRVRALTRNPDSAGLPRELDVVRGDLSMPGTLDECLVGVEGVFLLCSISVDPGPKWLRVKTFPGVVANGFQRYQFRRSLVHPGNRKQRKGGFNV
jgi:uncharacterized protein YbjT (DUF2867 family)